MDKLIHNYFKKGEEQGFSKKYVRDTLIKKGYDPVRVRLIYNSLKPAPSKRDSTFYNLASSANEESFHRISEKRRPATFFVGIAIVILFLIGTVAFFLHAWDGVPKGSILIDEEKTKNLRATLEDISARDSELSKKSQMIGDQLNQIENLGLSNEEKAQIIRRQLHEIQQLHKDIESHREDIHALLWELMKDILKKGQTTPDPRYE